MVIALEIERAEKLATEGALTEAQARKILAGILERTDNGEEFRSPSCRNWLEAWLEGKGETRAETTAVRYQVTIRGFLKALGKRADQPISGLTARDVQKYITARLRAGLAPSTVQIEGKALRAAFNQARREGLISVNPAEAVELPTRASVEKEVFTPAQVEILLDAAKGEWKSMILIGYYTGARLTECSKVHWDDIDLAGGWITFPAPKQKKAHRTPLHPGFQQYLESVAGDTNDYLCPKLAGVKTTGRRGLSESFKRIMREAGISDEMVQGSGTRRVSKYSFHSLRHTMNSLMANGGVSQEDRMAAIGHKNEAVNRKYTHLEASKLRGAIGVIPTVAIKA
jgi:integrase